MSPSTPVRRVARLAVAAAGLTALVTTLGPAEVASAKPRAPKPAFTVSGVGTWYLRTELGDAVANAPGTISPRNERDRPVDIAAVVGPDDRTLPGPGECEHAVTTVVAYRNSDVVDAIGDGEVCGFEPDGTSVITHVFTGTFEVIGGRREFRRVDGFFEVRLGADGTASVFAIDT